MTNNFSDGFLPQISQIYMFLEFLMNKKAIHRNQSSYKITVDYKDDLSSDLSYQH